MSARPMPEPSTSGVSPAAAAAADPYAATAFGGMSPLASLLPSTTPSPHAAPPAASFAQTPQPAQQPVSPMAASIMANSGPAKPQVQQHQPAQPQPQQQQAPLPQWGQATPQPFGQHQQPQAQPQWGPATPQPYGQQHQQAMAANPYYPQPQQYGHQPQGPSPFASQGQNPMAFGPGARVLVQWADGNRYPATVTQAQGNQCLVQFPDGQQRWVELKYLTAGV